jgi:hypothetical protein
MMAAVLRSVKNHDVLFRTSVNGDAKKHIKKEKGRG